MKANDKAIQLFLETNGRIVRAIELLQTPSDLSEDMTEMRGLLEIMGGHSISVLMNSSSLS